MTPSTDLFDLIHSLSPHEKRYFRLASVSNNGQVPLFLELFDLLNQMAEFDSDKLVAAIKTPRLRQRLPHVKHYLYQLILKSLRNYHADNEPTTQTRNLITDGILLYQRALYSQSTRIFRKARKIARQYELWGSLTEILDWQRRLNRRSKAKNQLQMALELAQEHEAAASGMARQTSYSILHEKALLLSQGKPTMTAPEQASATRAFLEDPRLAAGQPPEGFWSAHLYFHTQAIGHQILRQADKARLRYLELARHWEAHPQFIEAEPARYRAVLLNLLATLQSARFQDLFEEIRGKIDRLPPKTEHEERILQHNLLLFELLKAMDKNSPEEVREATQRIETWLDRYPDLLSHQRAYILAFNCVLAFLQADAPEEGLHWTSRLLNLGRVPVDISLQVVARFLHFIFLLQTRAIDEMEHTFRAIQRFIRLHSPDASDEMEFLRGLYQIARTSPVEQWSNDMRSLLAGAELLLQKWELRDRPGITALRQWLSQPTGEISSAQPLKKA